MDVITFTVEKNEDETCPIALKLGGTAAQDKAMASLLLKGEGTEKLQSYTTLSARPDGNYYCFAEASDAIHFLQALRHVFDHGANQSILTQAGCPPFTIDAEHFFEAVKEVEKLEFTLPQYDHYPGDAMPSAVDIPEKNMENQTHLPVFKGMEETELRDMISALEPQQGINESVGRNFLLKRLADDGVEGVERTCAKIIENPRGFQKFLPILDSHERKAFKDANLITRRAFVGIMSQAGIALTFSSFLPDEIKSLVQHVGAKKNEEKKKISAQTPGEMNNIEKKIETLDSQILENQKMITMTGISAGFTTASTLIMARTERLRAVINAVDYLTKAANVGEMNR